GFGAAFQHALSSSLISRTFEGSGRRAALGIYNSSGDVGKLAFTACFGLAVGMGIAWQGVAGGFGLMALIAAAALYLILRQLDVGGRPAADPGAGHPAGKIGWGIRNSTGFTALAMIVFLDIAVQSGFLTFVPFLMIEKQAPAGFAALAVVLTLGGGILGKFACGFLAERIGVIRSLVAVECLTAVGVVAVLLAPTPVAFLLLPLIGLVLQGSSSITYGSVGDLVQGERQSRGFAAIYSIASGSAILAPIGLGLIGDRYGLTPAMLTMACVVLLPLPLCVLLRPALAGEHA
ncbi:MAG TPA: MFS transporter, partial [Gammaproteobacteria bacterium]|nr:MFS transporter [Gammaproteobacteria bacterium]